MKILILFLIILISCDSIKEREEIFYTEGFDTTLVFKRYGLKITSEDSIYICEETSHGGEVYNYYKVEDNTFNYKDLNFNPLDYNKIGKKYSVDDGQEKQLVYIKNKKQLINQIFYYQNLNDRQITGILKLDSMYKRYRNSNLLKKIKYEEFPKELLLKRLPEPPPPPTHQNYMNNSN